MLWDLAGEDALTQIKTCTAARFVGVHPGGGRMSRQYAWKPLSICSPALKPSWEMLPFHVRCEQSRPA